MRSKSPIVLNRIRWLNRSVTDPRVLRSAEYLPPSEQRTLRLFGVTQCLRVRPAPGGGPA